MTNIFIRTIPNLFTIGNLLCGVFSITFTMNGYVRIAALFIFISAFLDLFDGRVARKLKVNSELGVELDSLADIVSFGVAPAILFHSLAGPSWLSSLAFILFPTMGALRLARFSVRPTVGYFLGIPITFAGLIIAGMSLFLYSNRFITIILAILMVTPIRVKKL
ncbi:CDP-diacylglycerol--serine O-phosphatidyltransferase [Neobacillus massiliamazoniensis]|uniref:CDP-diacylglycerol--serine O-phosphatidyltransferase n=1 Tax=Neobacillus massiliamazoniensis TaxID=1499688 RepID=A0A0U1P098_9BACI|nr:CDP-diacylglycerol--serine O-phosphatidyltransferase [Neobacillus massiliamazoniensis]CRK83667.1 CDP-diacylglycerol--serine O-phosphatidyltransferase [Neobacillus massiliamazoniensis]